MSHWKSVPLLLLILNAKVLGCILALSVACTLSLIEAWTLRSGYLDWGPTNLTSFFDRSIMEYRRGRSRKAREDEQPPDTEDQGTYDDAATRQARAGGAPGGPYPQSPLYQGQELGKARPPYPVSRELLRPNQYPRPRPGSTEIGEVRAGTSSYIQSSMSREPEIGVTSPVYPAAREPLRPIPGYRSCLPGQVTIDESVPTRPLHAPPPAFRGPKIGGAQPLYPVPPPIAPRQTSCDRRCRLDNHVDHRNCNTKCQNSRHAAHLEKDRLWAEYQRRFPTVGTQT